MWPTTNTWAELVAGDHETTVDVDAWYDGVATVPDLEVVDMSWSSSFDGSAVRSNLSLTVQDGDGTLVDETLTCPLGTYGQLLVARVTALLRPRRVDESDGLNESVPFGTFRIETSDPTYLFDRHKKTGILYPTGGTVAVTAQDCLADLAEAEFSGPTAPSGTVQAAMTALARGLVGADVSMLPTSTVPASVTYGDSKWAAVKALAATAGYVPVPSRDGTLSFRQPVIGTPVWDVTVDSDRLVSATLSHDRSGLENAVLATGEDTTDGVSPIRALAQESTGPLRTYGPFKLHLRRHSSPFYRTYTQALSGANSILAGLVKNRTAKVPFTCMWNPALDVLDTINLNHDPRRDPVAAMITSLKVDMVAATMSGEAIVPRGSL